MIEVRGFPFSPWKGRESGVKQHQLQPILIARSLAFNGVGRAEENSHVGLENWGWMRVQLDSLPKGSVACFLFRCFSWL